MLDEHIDVIPMPAKYSNRFLRWVYQIQVPYLYSDILEKLTVIKSNQLLGAEVGYRIGRKYKIPFLLRTGYTYTFLQSSKIKNAPTIKRRARLLYEQIKYGALERYLYKHSIVSTVSSNNDKEYLSQKYKVRNICVIPNYIDCNKFRNINDIRDREDRFLFVGRLSEEKNIKNIVSALGELKKGLDIYGQGELKDSLDNIIKENDYDVRLKGVISNDQLPEIYNSYKYFILASPFEGMPKALLEAMACGMICFGTNTSGIKEVITDQIDGVLIKDVSIESIQEAVKGHKTFREQEMSEKAVKKINSEFSIETVANSEINIISNAVK